MITSAPQQPSPAAPAPTPGTPPGPPFRAGSPPPIPKRWPALPAATWPIGGLVVAAGVGFDQAVRNGPGLGASLWATALVAVVACAIASHRPAPAVVPAPALAALVGAIGFAWSLSVRSTAWLIPLDLLAVVVLCGASVVAARGEDPWSLPGRDALRWFVHGLESALIAPLRTAQLGRRLLPRLGGTRGSAALRALALAAPVLLIVGALLVSADAFLASFLRAEVDAAPLVGHVLLVVVGAVVAVALALPAGAVDPDEITASPGAAPPGRAPRRLGTVEAVTLLGGLAVLFAVFVAAAVGAALAGDDYVRRQTGLSYAEYARRGFFQLLAVAAITFVVLVAVRARTTPTPVVRALGLVVVALIMAVVAVAVIRLGLYERAYGATMLRLFSTWFAWWLGAVFVVVGATWAGVARSRRWSGPAIAVLAFGWLAAVNVANPEAVVVQRNLAHAERTGVLDSYYLSELGVDATPALVAALEARPTEDLVQLVADRCPLAGSSVSPLRWSWSRWQADIALGRVCPNTTR